MAQTVGEIRLIADGTKVGFNHQLLIIAIAYRRRALPIAWTWVRSAKGHSSAHKQLALLAYVLGAKLFDRPLAELGDRPGARTRHEKETRLGLWGGRNGGEFNRPGLPGP
jgi:hypothetical protein